MLLILQQQLLSQDQDNLAVWLAVVWSPFIIAGYIFSLFTFLWKWPRTWARFLTLFYHCQSSALTEGRANWHPFIPHKAGTPTFHIALNGVDIFIKPQNWVDVNSRLKILNGKVKGNRKKIGTIYGPVVARSKTCLHPHGVCRKLPVTLKHTKKTVSPTAAQVITNCAFMPTDADTVNIHVQVWKGPAEAWMRSIDRDCCCSWPT